MNLKESGDINKLPKNFPMYCIDLKQTLDEKSNTLPKKDGVYSPMYYTDGRAGQFSCVTLKDHPNYPKQTNEHNALADARFNRDLYNFLNTI